MIKFKKMTIIGMILVPFLVATLMCCCISGDAQAQDEPVMAMAASSHDCCDKADSSQSKRSENSSHECKCDISALESVEKGTQIVVKNDVRVSDVVAMLDLLNVQSFPPSSKISSLRVSEASPPIYIRLAHLLI